MIYKGHKLVKIKDTDVIGGHYFKIYKNDVFITSAWTLSNAKEFIDSFKENTGYNYNVLA